ncbi:MAG: S41 family peptidase, partial [Candidatus Azobacteroides sp.]|nr:S41 family peptidase [Candidatus Azobacteroides sp.]
MQNIRYKKFNGLLFFSILLITYSCTKEDDPATQEAQKYNTVNKWIQSNMNTMYYWNTQMPAKQDLTLNPSDFFKSLLYTKEDHFSYIAEDYAELTNLLSGVQMEAGYDFTLFRKDSVSQDVIGVINYIKPNSPASLTDLKRGDIFFTINDEQLTLDNYLDLVNEIYSPHVLGVYRNGNIQPLSLNVVKYEENPVFLDSIYEINGKKIAYLIYNFFATDDGDYSYTYLKELNDIFGKFKQANVNELVLDLRFDTGGDAAVATALADMISGRKSSELFCTYEYNSIVDSELKKEMGDNYNKTFFDDHLAIQDKDGNVIDQSIPINKLTGLQRFYVLTSQRTASASELIINGLKPYMNVILVGEKTYGKNVGMWFLYEQDPVKQKDNRWGILPIVFKIFNSKNQSD